MFKRKIVNQLEKWLESLPRKRKALMLKGARQVGKTTVLNDFLSAHFDEVLAIDFKKNKSAKGIFAGDLDAETLLKRLKAAYPKYSFDPNKMVFFFDEIQDCNGARGCLKYLMEDTNFVVACSGSLLGIAGYNEERSPEVSVGFEYSMTMYPMDFEEYLWAREENPQIIESIRASLQEKAPLDQYLHERLSRIFLEYLCVGGMPEAVSTFLATSDLREAHKVKQDIIASYRSDFGKHLDTNGNEVIKTTLLSRINRVFDALPSELASERRRFILSHVDKGVTKEDYADAINWLISAGIVKECVNLNVPMTPLFSHIREGYYKLYFQDIGLFLGCLPFYVTASLYNENDDIGVYKGAIYENFVADVLNKNGFDLFYYRKDTGLEIDFVVEILGKVTLVESKATNGNAKSAKAVLTERHEIKRCIKITSSNLGDDGVFLTIPHYMAFLITPETII